MYKVQATATNQSQSLKQNTMKSSNNQKEGMPPINLSRQGSNKSASSSQSGKKTYDQNKNSQQSSRNISKQSSLAIDDSSTNKITEEKIKALIMENNNLAILLEEKTQEMDILKTSYKNQYKEIMGKVDQMELFIQQQDKQNQEMIQEQQQRDELIQQLQQKIGAQEQIIEQERIKCMGYQANFTQIESHIGQVIIENENLNIQRDQKYAEVKKKEQELKDACDRIQELEQQIYTQKERDPSVHQESDQLQKQLSDSQKANEGWEEEIANLKYQIEQLTQTNSECQQTIFQLYEKLDQQKDFNLNEQQKNNQDYPKQQFESQSTYDHTQMNIQDQNQNQNLIETIKQKDHQIQSLMEKISTQSISQDLKSSKQQEQEITILKEEIYHNQVVIDQLKEENTQLIEQIQIAQQALANRYETTSTQDYKSQKKQDFKKDLFKLQQDEVLNLKSQVNDLMNQINKLENQILEQCEKQTSILNEKVRAEQTAHHLNLQMETLKNELDNLSNLIKNKKQQNEKNSSKLEDFRIQIKQITQENNELVQQNRQLQNELNELKSQLSVTTISLESAQKLATIRGEEIGQFQDKFKQSVEQIDQYKQQYQTALETLLKYQNSITCN